MSKKKEVIEDVAETEEKPLIGRILAYVDGAGRVVQWFFPDIQETHLPADEHLVEVTEEAYDAFLGQPTWIIDGELTNEAPEDDGGDAEAVQLARLERNARIAQSDWVTLRAIETGEDVAPEWLAYRQDLRDVTEQEGFPHNIAWPSAPTS